MFSLHLSKDDYCETIGCGDEFARDEKWKEARDEAARIKSGTWRVEIPQEKQGLFTGKGGFKIGAYDPKAISLPIELQWPWPLSGTRCSPRRPALERVSFKGEVATLWKDFATTVTKLEFEGNTEARAFKERKDAKRTLRLVFKVTGAATNVRKVTKHGVTSDEGASPIALVKILGYQLREGDKVLWEKPAGSPP